MGTQAMYRASQGYDRDRHSQSIMHTQAMECEAKLLNVERHGGIQQAFQRQVCLQKYQIKDLNHGGEFNFDKAADLWGSL